MSDLQKNHRQSYRAQKSQYEQKERKKFRKNKIIMGMTCAVFSMNSAFAIFENGGFETGDFTGWEMSHGRNTRGLQGSQPYNHKSIDIQPGGTRIIKVTDQSFDVRAPHLQLPYNGNYTAKINDEGNNYHLNAIQQKDIITEEDRDPVDGKLHVRFAYAAVLDDPSHAAREQPFFHVQLTDLNTAEILYEDMAYSNQSGRLFYTTIYNGTWRATPFIEVDIVVPDTSLGHELEIRTLAADCSLGGHGGYVYVDSFGSKAIRPNQACLNDVKVRSKPNNVQITWGDTGASAYRVYRATRFDGPFSPVGETTSQYSTFLDKDVAIGEEYFYSVRPLDAEGREVCGSGSVVSIVPEHIEPGVDVNRPPRFVSDPLIDGSITSKYHYDVAAMDPDGDNLSFKLLKSPTGMSIDQNTGKVLWQPDSIGIYEISIEVQDDQGGKAIQSYSITVVDSNLPPEITNKIPPRIPSGKYFQHQVIAKDPENQRLSYSISSQAAGMTINQNGLISLGNPQPGRYPITVVVSDPHGAKAIEQTVLVVMGAPQFTSLPIVNGSVNAPYHYKAEAFDVDGDELTYHLAQAPQGMTIDAQTGEINWLPVAVGSESIIIEAKDPDGNTVKQTYTLKVTVAENQAPLITSQPITYINAGGNYVYQVVGQDPDGDNLMWRLLLAPKGMEINAKTGKVEWQKAVAGSYDVVIQVDDRRGGTAAQEYKLRVGVEANNPPAITSIPVTAWDVGIPYEYQMTTTDEDNDPLTFKLEKGPTGSLLSATGQFTWNNPTLGLHEIHISVSDGFAKLTQTYTLAVNEDQKNNLPPSITSTPKTRWEVGSPYEYRVLAKDPEGSQLTYTLKKAPQGAVIDSNGAFNWSDPKIGYHEIAIVVSDGYNLVEQGFTLFVHEKAIENQAPQILSEPFGLAQTGEPYEYALVAVDPDGDELTYTLEEGPVGAIFASDGRFIWNDPIKGQYPIKLKVSDGHFEVTQSYILEVQTEAVENFPPEITTTPKTRSEVGQAYEYQFSATDPDGDTLVYKMVKGPNDATFSANGLLTWAAPTVGTHKIVLSVADGHFEVTQSYDLTIHEKVYENQSPQILSEPFTLAAVNQRYEYQMVATDPDGDLLIYLMEEGPSDATFDSSGRFIWEKPTLGSHAIKLRVSDGSLYVTQSYVLKVQKDAVANLPPSITSKPNVQGWLDEAYAYQMVVVDPENDPLTYNLGKGPQGATLDQNGLLTWTNPTLGVHMFELEVKDGEYTVTQTFGLAINDKNDGGNANNKAPVITSKPHGYGEETVKYQYQVTANDPDGDPIRFTLLQGPIGMVVDAKTGLLVWANPIKGVYTIEIRADDGRAYQTQGYKLNISEKDSSGGIDDPDAGVFKGELFVSPNVVKVNQDVDIVLDLKGGEKPYQASAATLDGQPIILVNGTATVKSNQVGGHLVETVSMDASGNEIKFSKRFIVKDEADITAPTAEITSPANSDNINVAEITTSVDIIGTAMDENFVEYTLYISPADEKQWTPIKTSTVPVVKGKLGEIHPQTMSNGQYDLLLIVKDAGGNQSSASIGLMLKGEQKIGQFALSFEDLSFEAGSLPLFLTRTYDTLNQNSRLDFGFGWSATYQDVKIQTNRTPGFAWEIVKSGSGASAKFCPRPIGQRIVSVRMPGGTMERFKVKSSPECNTFAEQIGGHFFSIEFEPMSGTTSQLDPTDIGQLRVHNQELVDYDTLEAVNPQEFKLTTKNGDVYYLDKSFGIRQVKDKAGNTLSFTKNGIFHSGGANILFNRDAHGRINKVEATDGRKLSYKYDGDGNLQSVTDPKGETTQFTYLQHMKAPHQLDEIIGSDGKRLFKAEFDDKGQLIAQTDGNGFKVNLEHNTDKNEDVVIDQQGNKTIYLYDDEGNVNKVTDALGNTTTYTYDEFGNETSVTDALGNTTKYEYNKWGEVTKETNALGFSTKTSYNKNNEPTEFVDELGRKTVNLYTHDTMQLNGIVDAMGNTTSIGYSFSGNLGSISDPMGNTTSFNYQKINGKELKTSETDAAGNVTRFKYDEYGNEIERSYDVVQNGTKKTLTTKQSFDIKGNLLTSTDELGNVQKYEYNSLDQLTKQTDDKGRVTTYEYDGNGNQVKVTDPWGRVAETVYDAKGQVTKVCDDGVCSETIFDALGRETKSINALGFANESVYDGNGQLTESIDALGNKTQYEYDALGRQTKVTNALNITVSTSEYDAVGNPIKQTDAKGRSVINTYDDNNRLVEQKNTLNQVTKHSYDAAGRKIATEAPNGATKQFKYNGISQLYQVLDGLNQSTLYTYDSQGKLLTQTDANKQTTRFAYNDLGQRTSRTLPEGQVESANYNTKGELLSTKNFKGETTSFKYNTKDQLESITYPDKRVITHSYDAKGDLTETKDSLSGELTYQRDDLGQTLKVTTPTGELSYTWDGNGQKLSQEINQLGSYQYNYDALGRIVAVTDVEGKLTQFNYDEVGNRTKITRANGSESLYGYNDLNQLTKLEHKQGNQVLASFEYKLDNMGRKVEAKEVIDGKTRTLNYEYDLEGRLLAEKITEQGNVSETRYTHDAQGNRLSKIENGVKTSYSYNKNDQLLTETITNTDGTSNTINYGWDKNGNLLSKQSSDNAINIQYGWNSASRLIKVTGGSKTTTYQYDGEDRRIGKVIKDGDTTIETQYLIDSERNYDEIIVAKTRTTSGTQVGNWKEELYLYAPNGVGDLLTQAEAGQTHLYQDGHGSTRLMTEPNGNKLTFNYDAFGNPLTTATSDIKHRYVGEVLDEETGFYYFRARHYDPKIGRFISRDSFEGVKTTPISLNPYLYAHSDPVNGVDPSGYMTLGGMMSGISVSSVMTGIAINIATDVAIELGVTYLIYGELNLQKIQMAVLDATSDPLNYIPFGKVKKAGDFVGGTAKGLSKMIKEFRKFIRNPNLKKFQGNHNVILGIPSTPNAPSKQKFIFKDKKIISNKLRYSMYREGKGGRVFEFVYRIGKNAAIGAKNSPGFLFRLDYMDYRVDPAVFHMHYHIGSNGKVADHVPLFK